jgi:ParB-like chromosome segregation protein Spo0J
LTLKEIEPFEKNVRRDYDEEPMERLKDSIKQ